MSILVGHIRVSKIELCIPWTGCWEARAELQGAAPSGAVTIDWRGWKLTGGEVDPLRSATFAGVGRVVIVGGFRLSKSLAPKFYQGDQGLLASTPAQDAAREAGGVTLLVAPASDRSLGRYWARRRETAGAVMTRLFGRAWYVDLTSVARAGARPATALGAGVEVLSYDGRDAVVDLFAPRPDAAPLGAVVTSTRLPGPRRLVQLIARADGASERIQAYTEAA